MARMFDNIKWFVTPKKFKLTLIVRELIFLNYLIEKHIDYDDIKVREELYLASYLGALSQGPELKYLIKMNFFYRMTFSGLINSLLRGLKLMDIEMLKNSHQLIEAVIQGIRKDYREATNEDILENEIVKDYVESSKGRLKELDLYN